MSGRRKFKIGSLFSGVGALDLAVELAYDARCVWQIENDPHAAAVLRRHFAPEGTLVLEKDIDAVNPRKLPAIDILCAGFPCQDLSASGTGKDFDGDRSSLYKYLPRFASVLRPRIVVIENVPRLFSRYRDRIESDWKEIGYRVTWRLCSAAAAGAPHLRRRVFVECVRGKGPSVVLRVPDDGAAASSLWPTPTATNPNDAESMHAWQARNERVRKTSRPVSMPLSIAARWPTPTVKDKDGSGGRGSSSYKGRPGTSLTDAAVRFATPRASDARSGDARGRQGSASLPVQVGRLNANWHCALMGLPPTWTSTRGPSLYEAARELVLHPRWPAGRGEEQNWWEPARVVSGPAMKGRPGRIRCSGNAVVPQAALLALTFDPREPR